MNKKSAQLSCADLMFYLVRSLLSQKLKLFDFFKIYIGDFAILAAAAGAACMTCGVGTRC